MLLRKSKDGRFYLKIDDYQRRRSFCDTVSGEIRGNIVLFPDNGSNRLACSDRGIDTSAIRTESDYEPPIFGFKTAPMGHQRSLFDRIKDRNFFSFEWEMGLGKTKMALDLLAYKASKGIIDRALIIAPKGVHINWGYEGTKEHFSIPYEASYWRAGRKNNGMIVDWDSKKFRLASINYESLVTPSGFSYCRDFLLSSPVGSAIVLDEFHKIKSAKSKRTKHCLSLSNLAEVRYILSGTPTPTGLFDLWAPYTFLAPEIYDGMHYFNFTLRYGISKKISREKVYTVRGKKLSKSVNININVGFKNSDHLKGLLAPYRDCLKKEDVLDLPEKTYSRVSFLLGPEALKSYNSMLTDLRSDVGNERISVDSKLHLAGKLHQIASGFLMNEEGRPVYFANNQRLNILEEVTESCVKPAIIWVNYKAAQAQVLKYMRHLYGERVWGIFSGSSNEERESAICAFQSGEYDFLVSSPLVLGTGFTMTRARTVIYYNNNFSLENRLQSEDRAHRIGQRNNVTYIDIEALGTVDKKVTDALRAKKELSEVLSGGSFIKWISDE